jgi:AcrR family transcriptional regulator
MATRLTRLEQTEATRRGLLDAARAVFTKRGYHAATLDAVAEEAGFTKGAVYSRFESKADVFLALLEERIESRIAEMQKAAAAVRGPVDLATTLSRQWDDRLDQDEQWSLVLLEFRIHAARIPALNRRYAALHAKLRRAMAALIVSENEQVGEEPPIPAEDIARGALALGTGIVLERAAEGAKFPSHFTELTNRAMTFGFRLATDGAKTKLPRRRRA